MKGDKTSAGKPTLGMSKASQLLGISETTLRRWTDEGRIRVFITPGGHRRYSADELHQFMQARRAVQATANVASHLEATAAAHRITARTDIGSALSTPEAPREVQQRLARGGRELLDLVVRYIMHPGKREETMQLVRGVGEEHGRTLAALGFSLVDSLEAFIKHRNILVEAAAQFAKKRTVSSERAVATVPMVARILDEALISLVAAHQSYRQTGLVRSTKDESK